MMKKEKNNYVSPMVEVVKMEIEKGFAVSSTELPGWGDGGSIQDAVVNSLKL